jgi:hypothetical protein
MQVMPCDNFVVTIRELIANTKVFYRFHMDPPNDSHYARVWNPQYDDGSFRVVSKEEFDNLEKLGFEMVLIS